MAVTIAKHSVAQREEDGLSPLQYELIHEVRRVRIVDAPTGAGKTYAFQKALLSEQRVLFIVPTRRLAQNITGGLVNDLVSQEGWDEASAFNKVALLSSDQTLSLKSQGVRNIAGYRIRQLQELDSTRVGGEMVVAVPEVISMLLHRQYLSKGQAGYSVFDMLSDFDHIVFDEFHTIDASGFGLAALFAKLSSVTNETGSVGYGNAKVSFLSATPLSIRPTLEKLGIPVEQIAELSEELVEVGRPLHGDVALSLYQTDSMVTLLEQHIELVCEEFSRNRQVVIIYNALGDLRRDLPFIKGVLKQAEIDPQKVLVINSIDDSGSNHQGSYGFHSGRQQNPDDFNILIATASVEMGVTFREANVMLMEPGFAPMNFLQRYGRAARRGEDGNVVVRVDDKLKNRFPWLRTLSTWVEAQNEQSVSIYELSQCLSAEAQQRFTENDTLYFGTLSDHAVYASGLYWQVMIQHNSNKGFRAQHLRTHQPKSSAHIYALLKAFDAFLDDDYYQNSAQRWKDHFLSQALVLRDIGSRIQVIEADGRTIQVDRVWLARETNILSTPLQYDENDQEYVQLQGELDDYLLAPDEKNRADRMMTVYYPHKLQSPDLKADSSLIREWLQLIQDKRCMDTEAAWEDHPKAMQAAHDLVQRTGCVAGHENDIAAFAVSGVL